jgi:hypothetical protein
MAMAGVVWLSGMAAAQPAVTAKSRPQPAAIARPAGAAARPQVYRVPRELSGGDTHPFATEFYGVAPKANRPAAARPARKSSPRTAQR